MLRYRLACNNFLLKTLKITAWVNFLNFLVSHFCIFHAERMNAFNFSNIFWGSALIAEVPLIHSVIIVISGTSVCPDVTGDGLHRPKVKYFDLQFQLTEYPNNTIR
jgi:hypothetical protein